jgi:hypothetical protein
MLFNLDVSESLDEYACNAMPRHSRALDLQGGFGPLILELKSSKSRIVIGVRAA